MIKWYFCSLHKFEFGSEINTEDIDNINYLFVYQNNLNIIKKLNIKFDVNIEKLIHYLEQGMIDFIFVFYDKYNFIHHSGVSFNKIGLDKFFSNFQNRKYAVIGPTFTNPIYRGKNFYQKAISLQIKNILSKYKIEDIYISSDAKYKNSKAFKLNHMLNFSSGLSVSLFNKVFFFFVYGKGFKLRIFLNNFLLFQIN